MTHGLGLRKRLNLFLWINVGMLLLASAAVVLASGATLSDRSEFSTLTRANYDLTQKNNKLRAEVAMRDARFQAAKGAARSAGVEQALHGIQEVVDRYALENLRNGAATEKTADDVRREVCGRLAAEGWPCVP